MPKFETVENFGQEIGRAVITLITRKKGKIFTTYSSYDFKDINTEGAIMELNKIVKNLKKDLK